MRNKLIFVGLILSLLLVNFISAELYSYSDASTTYAVQSWFNIFIRMDNYFNNHNIFLFFI